MNKKYIRRFFFFLPLLLLFAIGVGAQENSKLTGRVVDDMNEPVTFASVFWLGTDIHTATGDDGGFSIHRSKLSNRLVVSCVGFVPDTLDIAPEAKEVAVMLRSIVMDDVKVLGYRKGRSRPRLSIENKEQINAGELIRAACCNLGESFTTNPSVDVSTTDAATGTKQIRLLGLSGKYVQMQTENYPNFRGISTPFSLGYIPGTDNVFTTDYYSIFYR